MRTLEREKTILSSFLFADADELHDGFLLEEQFFSTALHRRLAHKLNEEVSKSLMYSLLLAEIDDRILSTSNNLLKQQWIELLAASPVPLRFARELYLRMKKEIVCRQII